MSTRVAPLKEDRATNLFVGATTTNNTKVVPIEQGRSIEATNIRNWDLPTDPKKKKKNSKKKGCICIGLLCCLAGLLFVVLFNNASLLFIDTSIGGPLVSSPSPSAKDLGNSGDTDDARSDDITTTTGTTTTGTSGNTTGTTTTGTTTTGTTTTDTTTTGTTTTDTTTTTTTDGVGSGSGSTAATATSASSKESITLSIKFKEQLDTVVDADIVSAMILRGEAAASSADLAMHGTGYPALVAAYLSGVVKQSIRTMNASEHKAFINFGFLALTDESASFDGIDIEGKAWDLSSALHRCGFVLGKHMEGSSSFDKIVSFEKNGESNNFQTTIQQLFQLLSNIDQVSTFHAPSTTTTTTTTMTTLVQFRAHAYASFVRGLLQGTFLRTDSVLATSVYMRHSFVSIVRWSIRLLVTSHPVSDVCLCRKFYLSLTCNYNSHPCSLIFLTRSLHSHSLSLHISDVFVGRVHSY